MKEKKREKLTEYENMHSCQSMGKMKNRRSGIKQWSKLQNSALEISEMKSRAKEWSMQYDKVHYDEKWWAVLSEQCSQ